MESKYIVQIIVAVIFIKCPCSARIFNRRVTLYMGHLMGTENNLSQFHSFSGFQTLMSSYGFLEGSRVHVSITCPVADPLLEPQIWLLFCGTADTRTMYGMSDTQMNLEYQRLSGEVREPKSHDDSCLRFRLRGSASDTQFQYLFTKKIERSHFYSLLLLQVPSYAEHNETTENDIGHVSCDCHVTALNPGGKHLSSDELPLPIMYTVLNMLWALLVTTWFFNAVLYCKYSNRLHRLIVTVPVIKVLHVLLSLLWWQHVANTGVESSELTHLCRFVKCVDNALLFIIIMVIAEGWGVVRCRLKYYKWTSFLLFFVIFLTSLFCVHWLHRSFVAFSLCCVVIIMYKTLKWTSMNVDHLRRCRRKIRRFIQRQNLRYCGTVTVDMQLVQKLLLIRRFRIACAIFSLAYSVAVTLSTFLQEFAYIRALMFELPQLLLFIVLGFLFRLRNFQKYNNIELVSPKEDVAVLELPEVSYGYTDPHYLLGRPISFKVEKETQTPKRRVVLHGRFL